MRVTTFNSNRGPMRQRSRALRFNLPFRLLSRKLPAWDKTSLFIVGRVLLALVFGGLIGMERTFHGQRRRLSHACAGLSRLRAPDDGRGLPGPVDVHQRDRHHHHRSHPHRAGIMTGIGFLGAGVIFKEGLTVRGLTTAASIWITAAIGSRSGSDFTSPRCSARPPPWRSWRSSSRSSAECRLSSTCTTRCASRAMLVPSEDECAR